MNRRATILTLTIVLLLAVVSATAWLVATPSGLHWAYARVKQSLGDNVSLDRLDGRLIGPLTIGGLRYRTETVDAHIEQIDFDWSPAALFGGRLSIEPLVIRGARVALTPSSEQKEPTPFRLDLPLSIRLARLDATDIEIVRAGQTPIQIHAAQFTGALDADTLTIDHMEIRTSIADIAAAGALGLADSDERLRIDWRVHTTAIAPLAGSATLSGNLKNFTIAANTTEPIQSALQGNVKDLLTKPTWQANLQMPTAELASIKSDLKGSLALRLEANGDREQFNSRGTLEARYPSLPFLATEFRLRGSFAGQLHLDEARIRAPDSDTGLSARGAWNIGKQAGQLHAQWRNLNWPLTGVPFLSSPNGKLEFAGSIASYRLAVTGDLRGNNLPPASLEFAAVGNQTQLTIDELTMQTMGGHVAGTGEVIWSPRLSWSADFTGQDMDPGTVWPEWQGNVALSASMSGDTEKIALSLESLSGKLRGRTVSARGNVVRRGLEFPVIAIDAQSGDAKASVKGSLLKQWNVAWQLNAPDLGALWPLSSGRVQSNGQLLGPRNTPVISARVTGRDVVVTDFRARDVDLDMKADLSDRDSSRLAVQLREAVYGEREISQASVTADGHFSKHSVGITAQSGEINLQMHLIGSYSAKAWRGELAASTWKIGTENWTLARPAPWLISLERVTLNQTCWLSGTAQLCTQIDRAASGNATLGLTATRVPLALLGPALAQPIEIRGSLDGSATATLRGGKLDQAEAQFQTTPGSVRLTASGPGATLAYEQVTFTLHVDDSGLRSRTELKLPGGDGASAGVTLPRFGADPSLGRNQPIRGTMQATLRDLSPLAALLPEVEELRGALNAQFAIEGTLADPRVLGEARLTDGSARITTLGVQLRDTRLIATPEGRNIRLNGFARSGDGELGITGRLLFGTEPAWRLEARLAGGQFQVVDVAEANVRVSPDLRINVAPGIVNVEGEVLVPQARIAPRSRQQAVTPSRDVVIVDASREETSARPGWDVTAQVRVILGDAVNFEGFGLTGGIKGEVILVDSPTQVTTGQGELRVTNGRYEAYGQKLEIERGRLLFAGGPIDDPGIDARAIRRVETITAGIEVKGTLRAPQLTLFSDPPMGQSDALSYLLFGKPIESANASQGAALASAARALQLSGGEFIAQRIGARFGIEEVEIQSGSGSEAALVLGKRLSPRLYVNYSIGLFEPINVFRIRYELTTRWVLQAESGLNSGADLVYTIER